MDLSTGPTIATLLKKVMPEAVMWVPDHLENIERAQYCEAWNVLLPGGGYRMADLSGRIIGWLPAQNASGVFRSIMSLDMEVEIA